jgi:hypothetical protein
MIEASRKAYDRSVELYGDPVTHLRDRVDAQNLVRTKIDPAAPMSPVVLVATELVELGIALLRAQAGQERTVCGLAMSRIAALASGIDQPVTTTPPETTRAPTPFTTPREKPTDNAIAKLENALGSVVPTPPAEPSSAA